jgi:hypothetical protein
MSPFVILVVTFLVVLFAALSLLPAAIKDTDSDSLVQSED